MEGNTKEFQLHYIPLLFSRSDSNMLWKVSMLSHPLKSKKAVGPAVLITSPSSPGLLWLASWRLAQNTRSLWENRGLMVPHSKTATNLQVVTRLIWMSCFTHGHDMTERQNVHNVHKHTGSSLSQCKCQAWMAKKSSCYTVKLQEAYKPLNITHCT